MITSQRFYKMLIIFMAAGIIHESQAQLSSETMLYDLNSPIESRSISFENITGVKGGGGKEANHLGVGRKGFPAKTIEPGETVVLCNIQGPGTIRHIWMTGTWTNFDWLEDSLRHTLLRSTVIRAWWDHQSSPSIECPLGDFMGFAHAKVRSYQSAAHSIGENGAFNFWIPMPFIKQAKMTLTNESDKSLILYYQINYTIHDPHPENVGRLHVCFQRENPTQLKKDFELLPKRTGRGRYIGAVIGIRALEKNWWGEGEIKLYMDGDTSFPTICGTGSEDYVCLSYGIQETMFLYHGCSLNHWDDARGNGFISMYRWHLPDPIVWKRECRMTIQQIGWSNDMPGNLYERQDDWSAATFWYESIPSAPLPDLPSVGERTVDLVNE
ncbi:glycoside hydrolase family 172 protein [bacterium]